MVLNEISSSWVGVWTEFLKLDQSGTPHSHSDRLAGWVRLVPPAKNHDLRGPGATPGKPIRRGIGNSLKMRLCLHR